MRKLVLAAVVVTALLGEAVVDEVSPLVPFVRVSVQFQMPPLLRGKFLNPAYPVVVAQVSAYNSEPGQTDSTPFLTAWNTEVRDGIVAANGLPFGTVVRIPELFGKKDFVVEDRMNRRYDWDRQTPALDIWMADKDEAIQFARRHGVLVHVIRYPITGGS